MLGASLAKGAGKLQRRGPSFLLPVCFRGTISLASLLLLETQQKVFYRFTSSCTHRKLYTRAARNFPNIYPIITKRRRKLFNLYFFILDILERYSVSMYLCMCFLAFMLCTHFTTYRCVSYSYLMDKNEQRVSVNHDNT